MTATLTRPELLSSSANQIKPAPIGEDFSVFQIAEGDDWRPIRVELVYLSPSDASELLKLNKHNRPVSQTKVEQIRHDIESGNFKFNAAPIVIDERPEIIDGQHRLYAIAKSNRRVPVLIVTGVATNVADTIDTLCKTRSVSDILHLKYEHDDLKNRTVVDGIATLLIIGETGSKSHTKPEIAEYANTHIKVIAPWAAWGKSVQGACQKVVIQRHRLASSMPASAVGALAICMVDNGADSELVTDFLWRIATGTIEDSDKTNIIPLMRKRQAGGIILGGSGGRSQVTSMFTEFATYINAYNRWVSGETAQGIKGVKEVIRDFSGLPSISTIGC